MADRVMELNQLPEGASGEIVSLNSVGSVRNRMLDLGLVPQTLVTAVHRSPLGDPVAFLVRGTVIALRAEESQQVLVKLIADEKGEANHGSNQSVDRVDGLFK